MFKFIFKFILGIIIFVVLIVGVVLFLGYKNYNKDFTYDDTTVEDLLYNKVNLGLEKINSGEKDDLEIELTEIDLSNILYKSVKDMVGLSFDENVSIEDIWITFSGSKVEANVQLKTIKYVNYYSAVSITFDANVSEDLIFSLTFDKAKLGKVSLSDNIVASIITWSNLEEENNETINFSNMMIVIDMKDFIDEAIGRNYSNLIYDNKLVELKVENSILFSVKVSKAKTDDAALPEYLSTEKEAEYKENLKTLVAKYMMKKIGTNDVYLELSQKDFNQLLYFDLLDGVTNSQEIKIGDETHTVKLLGLYFDFLTGKQKLNIVVMFDDIKFLIHADTKMGSYYSALEISLSDVKIKDIVLSSSELLEIIEKLKIGMLTIENNNLSIKFSDINNILSESFSITDIDYDNMLKLQIEFEQETQINELVDQVKNNLGAVVEKIADNPEVQATLSSVVDAITNNEDVAEKVDTFIEVFEDLPEEEQTDIINYILENVDEDQLNEIFKMLGV